MSEIVDYSQKYQGSQWKPYQRFSWGRFRQWLENKNPTDIVGSSNDPYECPISLFLRDKYDLEKWDIRTEHWISHSYISTYPFMWNGLISVRHHGYERFDNHSAIGYFLLILDHRFIGPVTAKQCLDIMDGKIKLNVVISNVSLSHYYPLLHGRN